MEYFSRLKKIKFAGTWIQLEKKSSGVANANEERQKWYVELNIIS